MARRRALVAVSAALILCVATFGVLNARAVSVVRIFVDGQEVVPDVPAQIIEGRTMVPIRFVAEAMDAEVTWNPNLYAVEITTDRSQEAKAYMDWLERWRNVLDENTRLSRQLPSGARPGDQQAMALLRQMSANLEGILTLARTIRPPKDAVRDFHETCEQILRVKLAIDLMVRSHEEALRGNMAGALALASAAAAIMPGAPAGDGASSGAPPTTTEEPPLVQSPGGVFSRRYAGLGSGHWISKNVDGKYITLEDGSLWEISSFDQINTRLWLTTDDITVAENDNPFYPYLLINTDEGEKAEAKLVAP